MLSEKDRPHPLDAKVISFHKRRMPSKYYTYCVDVFYDDHSSKVIFRRYSHFFSFQCKLLDIFQEEAGEKDPSRRIIPFLPGKIFLSRSQVREVAEARKAKLHNYCQQLFKLPDRITQSGLVQDFFSQWPEDSKVPFATKQDSVSSVQMNISNPEPVEEFEVVADFKAMETGEVDVKEGELVQVLEKKNTGWWFVATDRGEGWIPASFLDTQDLAPVPTDNPTGDRYKCTVEYQAKERDEVSLKQGQTVVVLEKNLTGWWRIESGGRTGWVPAMVLVRVSTMKLGRSQQSRKFKLKMTFNDTSLARQNTIPPRPSSVMSSPRSPAPAPAPEEKHETAIAVADFHAEGASSALDMKRGQKFTVLARSSRKWTMVKNHLGQEGWVPTSFLTEEDTAKQQVKIPATKIAANVNSGGKNNLPRVRKQVPESPLAKDIVPEVQAKLCRQPSIEDPDDSPDYENTWDNWSQKSTEKPPRPPPPGQAEQAPPLPPRSPRNASSSDEEPRVKKTGKLPQAKQWGSEEMLDRRKPQANHMKPSVVASPEPRNGHPVFEKPWLKNNGSVPQLPPKLPNKSPVGQPKKQNTEENGKPAGLVKKNPFLMNDSSGNKAPIQGKKDEDVKSDPWKTRRMNCNDGFSSDGSGLAKDRVRKDENSVQSETSAVRNNPWMTKVSVEEVKVGVKGAVPTPLTLAMAQNAGKGLLKPKSQWQEPKVAPNVPAKPPNFRAGQPPQIQAKPRSPPITNRTHPKAISVRSESDDEEDYDYVYTKVDPSHGSVGSTRISDGMSRPVYTDPSSIRSKLPTPPLRMDKPPAKPPRTN